MTNAITGNGLVVGGVDFMGVDPVTGATITVVDDVEGLGSTKSTAQLTQRARRSGATAGDAFYAARHIAAKGLVQGEPLAVSLTLDRIKAAISLDETLLTVTEYGRERWTMVRREDDVDTKHVRPHLGTWSWQVFSEDYRLFGQELSKETLLPTSIGGLKVPHKIPYKIAATTVTGQVSLENPGNTPGPVRLRIDGPCSGPIITHLSTGAQLIFSTSLVLGPGEFLIVDMEERTVLAQGEAGRAGWIDSRGWSQFDPGLNTWAFTAAFYNPASKLTVFATPSWQ